MAILPMLRVVTLIFNNREDYQIILETLLKILETVEYSYEQYVKINTREV